MFQIDAVNVSDLHYEYPPKMIATEPRFPPRVLFNFKREGQTFREEVPFDRLPDLFQSGDLLLLNNTKVLFRRLFTETEKGKKDVLFLEPLETPEKEKGTFWKVLCVSKYFQAGKKYPLPEGQTFSLIKRSYPQVVLLEKPLKEDYFTRYGELPLPPYILQQRKQKKQKKQKKDPVPPAQRDRDHRDQGQDRDQDWDQDQDWDRDRDTRNYQSPWAKVGGSLAAPTASLHFQQRHLSLLREKGVSIHFITLHIGLDTFAPIRTTSLKDHVMHREWVSIPKESATAFEKTRARGGRVWAMGTTVVRAMESWKAQGLSRNERGDYEGETSLMIVPGHPFKSIDGLLTNFHQPRSTLLALVAAFFGLEEVKKTYAWALQRRFRFFSYGDLTVWMR